jgi:hypothetical protein
MAVRSVLRYAEVAILCNVWKSYWALDPQELLSEGSDRLRHCFGVGVKGVTMSIDITPLLFACPCSGCFAGRVEWQLF